MGIEYSYTEPDGDPYRFAPMQALLPASWQYNLSYDPNKISGPYFTQRALLDGRVAAMNDGDYKSNFTQLYYHTLQLQAMKYYDPDYKSTFEQDVNNKAELIEWYQQRDKTHVVTVPALYHEKMKGVVFETVTSTFMDAELRMYTVDHPEAEKWLMDLAAFMGDVHNAKRFPDDGPSEVAAALLTRARELRKEYDELNKDQTYFNDPLNNHAMLARAQPLYDQVLHEIHQFTSITTGEALKEAMGNLNSIIKDLGGRVMDDRDKQPIDLTDDEALAAEGFPAFERWWVDLSFKRKLPEQLSGAFDVIRDVKMFSMDNSGLVISFLANAFISGFSPALVATGITAAYKTYYKEKGTGPLADLSAKALLPQAASDSRFMDSIKAGKTILSDIDYAALLLLQARLAGKATLLGTLAGYGGAKTISDMWDAIIEIPGVGWLLGLIGADVKEMVNDVSSSATSGFL